MPVFSDEVWRDHFVRTAGGWRPYLYKSILPLADGFSGPIDAQEAFFSLRDDKFRERVDCRVRIYLDEERRDDLIPGVFREPVGMAALDQFLIEYTKVDRFGLVINNFEQASAKLAADFALLTGSYFRAHGMPIGGTEQVAFCGNYSGTAFGIHEGYEHALLCHLGPGTKYFYCWSREAYVAATGGREPIFGDSPLYEALLDSAECFPLEPGDVLYLPAGVYHIGRQTEYSVSVALPLYTYPLKRFAGRGILPGLIDLTMEFDKEGMSEMLGLREKNPILGPLTKILEAQFRSWLGSDVARFTSFYWSRLRSNGGWELPRMIAGDLLNDDLFEPLLIRQGSTVRTKAPYRIEVVKGLDCQASDWRLFLGGRSVIVDDAADVMPYLEELNSGSALIAGSPAMVRVLTTLSRTGGLELCEL